ncbi:MAG: transglycosylase SLT domain-containing protein [Solirubrobacteraceae bacterium]|nr:transglycosylase SLT domain-containing protein [Solirubrobacteraceae bacterium]
MSPITGFLLRPAPQAGRPVGGPHDRHDAADHAATDAGATGSAAPGPGATGWAATDSSAAVPDAADEPSASHPDPGAAGLSVVLAPADRAELAGASVVAWRGPAGRRAVPILAVWSTIPARPGGSATARARRIAARIDGEGLDARASGRIVRVTLPADDGQAAAAVWRLRQAEHGPVTLVLAGPWGPEMLPLLESSGTVHAAGSDAAIAACRVTLARHRVRVLPVPRPTGPVARSLLRAGWTGRSQVRRTAPCTDRPVAADPPPGERGQALMLVITGLLIAIVVAGVLGAAAAAMGSREDDQRAVDMAALAAADRMRVDWPDRAGVPATLSLERFRQRARDAARRAAARNGIDGRLEITFPEGAPDDAGPLTVRVSAPAPAEVAGVRLGPGVSATAQLSPPAAASPGDLTGNEYRGPLARRDGKPMRPDVAVAYDRMAAAARKAGHHLMVVSGFRSNAEQAALFAKNPDPKWVAPPGRSNHRLGIALDIGPPGAYGWLLANSRRFGFVRPMDWEPWHFELRLNVGSSLEARPTTTRTASTGASDRGATSRSTIPPWVPQRFRDLIRSASIRHKVSAALLSAQLRQESGFDPRAVSSAGAQGIAQFMPDTARGMGLRDPFDPAQAIDAQARLMAGLLRRFGSVQLALAAYNAGPGAVQRFNGIPPYAETKQYVARIVAMMRGYDPDGGFSDVMTIRLTA